MKGRAKEGTKKEEKGVEERKQCQDVVAYKQFYFFTMLKAGNPTSCL